VLKIRVPFWRYIYKFAEQAKITLYVFLKKCLQLIFTLQCAIS